MSDQVDRNTRPASTRPLKVGLHLPNADDMIPGSTARWSEIVAMARRAEELGFDSIWVMDHLLLRFTGWETSPVGIWEGWSLLAALAASTERVVLGPLVTCTSFRNPALLAKMADTVDEISGGRLVLGLGAGWNEGEYRAFGYPFDHRASRFEEALTIITTLLRDGGIDFAGSYYTARECELRPRGPCPQGPPIMIGTTGERMLSLAARYADQWNVDWTNQATEIPPLREKVDAACIDVGRDPTTLARTVAIMIDLPGHHRRPKGNLVASIREGAATGQPEELAALLRAYAAEGIEHVQVWLDPCSLAGVEAFAPVLELLDSK
jgi:probable F420-dependent oxidoreductase